MPGFPHITSRLMSPALTSREPGQPEVRVRKPAVISMTSGLVVKPSPHGQFVMAILEQRDGGKQTLPSTGPCQGQSGPLMASHISAGLLLGRTFQHPTSSKLISREEIK